MASMSTKTLIGYVRVSTSRQSRSGLGIEAQREAPARFAASDGFELVRVFIEVETGKGADALDRRPQLFSSPQRRPPLAVPGGRGQTGLAQSRCAFHLWAHGTPRAIPGR